MLTESVIQGVVTNILRREGGDESNPLDHGGETHFGVTQGFAAKWNIPWPPTYQDAAQGYRRMLAGTNIDKIPDAATLDLVADSAVNHGEGRAVQWLQAALGVRPDGDIGPITIAAMQPKQVLPTANWPLIYKAILKNRGMFYAHIIHNEMITNPNRALRDSQVEFIDGWFDRLFSFL